MIKINNQINVREARADDVKEWYNWFNDKETTKWMSMHGKIPNTIEQQDKFYKIHSTGDNGKIIFIICDTKKCDLPVGVCSFNYNVGNRFIGRFEISLVIGNQKYQKANNYLDATIWQINHAFFELNANSIFAVTSEYNTVVQFTLKKIGFRKVGVLKDYSYEDGKYSDCIYFELLRKDWNKD